jgi:DNA-binding transcriptional LysR family regulator
MCGTPYEPLPICFHSTELRDAFGFQPVGEATRRAARPEKAAFAIGFLAGQEPVWLPEALRILREEQPDIEITLASQSSPELGGALVRGKVDVAFLRREKDAPAGKPGLIITAWANLIIEISLDFYISP